MPDPIAETPPGLASDAARSHARYGLILFFVYACLYGGFIVLAAFDADRMARPALAGVNLAIVYGLGLIVSAFALALIYMLLCRTRQETR